MYDINGALITNKTPFNQLGPPFKLFTPELLQTLLEESTRKPCPVQMVQPQAFQIKNKDFPPWLHFIPSRKKYDQGCLIYLVEADPLETGHNLLKVGLTLETDPLRRDRKAYRQVLSQFKVPPGINPMVVERLTILCCSQVGSLSAHYKPVIESIMCQSKRWGGYTELVKSTDDIVIATFEYIIPRICDFLLNHSAFVVFQEWNLFAHLWDVKFSKFSNKASYCCTCDPFFDFFIESKRIYRSAVERRINRQLQPIADQFPAKGKLFYRKMALDRLERKHSRSFLTRLEQAYYYRETGKHLTSQFGPQLLGIEQLRNEMRKLEKDSSALRTAMLGEFIDIKSIPWPPPP